MNNGVYALPGFMVPAAKNWKSQLLTNEDGSVKLCVYVGKPGTKVYYSLGIPGWNWGFIKDAQYFIDKGYPQEVIDEVLKFADYLEEEVTELPEGTVIPDIIINGWPLPITESPIEGKVYWILNIPKFILPAGDTEVQISANGKLLKYTITRPDFSIHYNTPYNTPSSSAVGGGSSGSSIGGLTENERAMLNGAAQRSEDNTFTASNTFAGEVDMSGAQVTPPDGWNVEGVWMSDTVPVVVGLEEYAERKFVAGGRFSIVGELVPGGNLKRLLCCTAGEGTRLRLQQRVPSTGELVTVGYGTLVEQNVRVPGASATFDAFEFDPGCELAVGRELVADIVDMEEAASYFIYATGPAAGCAIFGKVNLEAEEEWYDGWLVPCYFEFEQERRWRVSSAGDPVLPQLGDKLKICNTTWFDNTTQSSISVQAAPWKNEVMTCYLKTSLPVSISGVTWLHEAPAMVEGPTYVISLQQVDATTVLANLTYTIPQ
jgi:hypothetical protein